MSSIFLLNSFASNTEFCHSSDQDAKETDIDFLRGHAYLPPQFFYQMAGIAGKRMTYILANTAQLTCA